MGCAAPSPFHWQDLRSRPREDILRQPGVKTAIDAVGFEVPFLNARYLVDPIHEVIRELTPRPSRQLSEEFQILLIRYLVANYGGEPTGEDISEKDLPGGVTFFQGPHALYVGPIAHRYGTDPEGFEQRCLELGAIPGAYGDKGMRFLPFPLMPVTYVLWKQDDEFPASVTVLFDKSIGRWFELDMVFALVLALTERIMQRDADGE
ncbi:MAG: DUF3786 domain-containing protein [Desulfomonile tiedjei]|nr:DUF3786 domain-containing protein [Desulfomonile tiedjei]